MVVIKGGRADKLGSSAKTKVELERAKGELEQFCKEIYLYVKTTLA